MRNIAFIVLFVLGAYQGSSQTPKDLAVDLSAVVQESPNQIRLQWPSTNANQIRIYRKEDKTNSSFGGPVATLSGNETSYIDNTVIIGQDYEFRVEKVYSNYSANGYILSGIKVLPEDYRGKLVLLVEAVMATPLLQELKTLQDDLIGDGWEVVRHDVQTNATPPQVKNRIVQEYNSAPNEVKALLIIGHIAVPYSGLIFPDGHVEHRGAWPTDSYYGDMDGIWTDTSVNYTSSDDQRNHNVPGDGKFDQSELPSDLELQVGRVDFHNLEVFSQNETELLRKYLNKNHAFRNKMFTATPRALIDDNFGGGINSFSSSAYRSFNVMFGSANVDDKDYFTTMDNESYLWSHGNGPGFYDRARDVGTSQDFANIEVKSVFTTLFGSWHGDWDSKNNFMRSALASGNILTCAWSGIPQWQFHQMNLGENIGFSAKNTSNGFEYEFSPYSSKSIHIGLIGDPTLRMHVVEPPSNLQAADNNGAELTWNASNDNQVLGYHVYYKSDSESVYQRLTDDLITDVNYTASNIPGGQYTFMVRAIKLEQTRSGSFYNLSQGIFSEIELGEPEPEPEPEPEILIADAGSDMIITCTVQSVQLGGPNTSSDASYNWSTVDGTFESATDQQLVTINAPGTYVLEVSKEGSETVTDDVVITMDIEIPLIELGDSVTINSGDEVNIGVATTTDYTYTWSPSDSLNDGSIANPVASPSSTTTYTLQVTGPNGCVSEDSITVTVEGTEPEPEPEPEILVADAGGDMIITCTVQSVQLGGPNTSSEASYNWSTVDGTFESATDQQQVTVNAPGTYVLEVSKEGSETVMDEVVITSDTDIPLIELGDSVTIKSGDEVNIGVATTIDYTYTWSPSDSLNDGSIADPIASPSSTTTYTLQVSAPNGCISEDSITVTVEEPEVDIGEMEPETDNKGRIVIYPNPATEILHIESDAVIEAIAISDMTDRTILKSTSKDIDVSTLPSGVYIIHFIADGKLVVRNFIKQ